MRRQSTKLLSATAGTRASHDLADPQARRAQRTLCQDAVSDEPQPGHYKTRLVRGGPYVPVRIHWGSPVIDGEEQDRAPRWLVTVDGATDFVETGDAGYRCRVPLDVWRYWPWCGKHPIGEPEYRYLIDKAKWAKEHAKDRPEAHPRKAVDKRGPSIF